MKQQFFVGDVVRICDTPQESTHVDWTDLMDGYAGDVRTVAEVSEYNHSGQLGYVVDNGYYFDAKWLTIVERAWQENTGEQPVEDVVEVFVKYIDGTVDYAEASMFDWGKCQPDGSGISEWRIADSVSSNEEQPEAIPPSHVALGDEMVSTDVPTEQDKKHSHYFKKCGYDYVDVYRILKMFDVTDPCISHACKKLLVTGGRGFKDIDHDIQDVIDTLVRWQEMRKEDGDA